MKTGEKTKSLVRASDRLYRAEVKHYGLRTGTRRCSGHEVRQGPNFWTPKRGPHHNFLTTDPILGSKIRTQKWNPDVVFLEPARFPFPPASHAWASACLPVPVSFLFGRHHNSSRHANANCTEACSDTPRVAPLCVSVFSVVRAGRPKRKAERLPARPPDC